MACASLGTGASTHMALAGPCCARLELPEASRGALAHRRVLLLLCLSGASLCSCLQTKPPKV